LPTLTDRENVWHEGLGGIMKSILFVVSVVALFLTPQAFASGEAPFEILKDGVRFSCTAQSSTASDAPIRCAEKAYQGPFSRDESTSLCARAQSNAPADCARAAYAGPFDKASSIELCRYATSDAPVECAKAAYAGPFSSAEAARLCAQYGTRATADCAINAYRGPYTKAQAIALCR
jgi:hypothetical protein